MKSLTALSLSIAVLGAVATFLALQVAGGFVLIWVADSTRKCNRWVDF